MANVWSIWKCSILTSIIFYCMTGVVEGTIITYALLRRFSVRFFLQSLRLPLLVSYVAPVLILLTATVGWNAVSSVRIKLIKTFSVLLSIAVLVELGVSVWCFTQQQEFSRQLTFSLNQKFHQQVTQNTSDWWDVLQSELHCCGVNGPSDYVSLHNKVPASCFNSNIPSTVGCFFALKDGALEDFGMVALTLIIAACLQLPGVFMSWCFANRMADVEI